MMQSENINELATALAKAQGEISPAIKDNINPHFKSKYADLNSVWNACRSPLSKNNLAVLQTMTQQDGQLMVVTTLAHSSGQWIKSQIPVILTNNTAQALGSALTYMRRYALSAMVGVAPDDDDDAEQASLPYKKSESKKIENIKIEPQKAAELEKILTECDPQYQETVWKTLRSGDRPIEDLKDLPVDIYQRLYPAAVKNRLKHLELQQQEAHV